MNKAIPTLTLAAAALLTAAAAWAEKADRQRPMNIEADALRYDDARQTSVFTGSVVATKGTIVIRGARMEVRQDPQGYQFGVVNAPAGQRAFWRQKRDGVDEFIEGEAETIEFDGKADRVRFTGRAELRRYRGAVLADETQGSLITYDSRSDEFTVDGGRPAGGGTGGRVRAVLAPREAEPAPAPAPAPAGAPLRSSPALGGERK